MAENENNAVENTAEENVTKVDMSKFKSADDDGVIKVDLSKPITNETEETKADPAGVVGSDENADTPQEQKEVQPQGEVQETDTPVLEEITNSSPKQAKEVEEIKQEVEKAVTDSISSGDPLPEKIQKLVDFMNETGGDLNDYVNLNRDISKLDDSEVIDEYYRLTKPHLNSTERNFLLENEFSYDEDVDDDRTIRSKKIALKEQVAEARAYLDGQKSKYYEEIKAGKKLSPEQQKAMDFFNRYNKESKKNKKILEANKKHFLNTTNNVFNNEFEGFEYNVGDKRFKYNIKNVEDVKAKQTDIKNFIGKYLDENNQMKDAAGYHKSLFTAMNADAVAKHFYEQGKADAIKDSVAKAKNVDLNPRSTHGEVNTGGIKVRVLGDDSNSLKFKMRKRK
jgi:hypothetical protein